MRHLSILLSLSLFAAMLLATTLATEAEAQDVAEKPQVKVEVDGLACPFCAFGVEKKLKKLDGVSAVEVQIDEGFVLLTLEEGADVTEEKIRNAVADAGFTVRAITWPDSPAPQTG